MKNYKVVIVDDDELMRNTLSLVLEKHFDILFFAENGNDLLLKLEEADQLPDLCVCDINMPVMDGFETVKAVNSIYPGIKILAFSTDDSPSIQSEIIKCGAAAFISKLNKPTGIVNKIRELLE